VGTGDFNGDGRSDILWQHDSGVIALWELNGNQVIGSSSLGSLPTNWSVETVRDFNGDANADILWRDNSSGLEALWELAGGQVVAGAAVATLPASLHAVSNHYDLV
jgi:hypothetical protein